jgi:hypothetical protein
MKVRWILLSLLASLLVGWLVYWYQGLIAWKVNLPEGSSVLQVNEQAGVIYLDENSDPTIIPAMITKRSLATGQEIGHIHLPEHDTLLRDFSSVQISRDENYVLLSEVSRRNNEGRAYLYKASTGEALQEWNLHHFTSQAISFSHESKHLLIGVEDKDKPDKGHVLRIVDLETMDEKRIEAPREFGANIVQVLSTHDLSHVAVRVSSRWRQNLGAHQVILLDCKTSMKAGRWVCSNTPLVQLSSHGFAFHIEDDEGFEREFVSIQADRQPCDKHLLFKYKIKGDYYHYQGVKFMKFCDDETQRLLRTSVVCNANRNGEALINLEFSKPLKELLKASKNDTDKPMLVHRIHWLDFSTGNCSAPLLIGLGHMHVVSEGMIMMDEKQHLSFHRFPSKWRIVFSVVSGLAACLFMLLVIRLLDRRKASAT